MKLKPLDDRLIVNPLPADELTESGLFIPVQAQSLQNIGKVLARGSAVSDIAVGDYVLYGRYSGVMIENDGVDCIVLKRSEVLCVVEEFEAPKTVAGLIAFNKPKESTHA